MKQKFKSILPFISWRGFANVYFEKSPLWFFEKMEGSDQEKGFSKEETETLKHGLNELSERIKSVANSL